jgi:ubiquinone/menaquinone biosynthesis C-methylase UbiE
MDGNLDTTVWGAALDLRLQHEIEHGRKIVDCAGEIWNWETPAGKKRWKRRVAMLAAHISSDMNVLEIGCGTGYFTKELAKTGARIVAVDISEDLLARARRETSAPNVEFRLENAYELESVSNGSFDTVVGSSVLHHLDIEKALREIFRVVKSSGTIAFTEPNMLNPQIAAQKNISLIKRWAGDSPDETAFFKWQIERLLQKSGFSGIRVLPFDFLHPAVPQFLIGFATAIGDVLERTPLVKHIAGSLWITCTKDGAAK